MDKKRSRSDGNDVPNNHRTFRERIITRVEASEDNRNNGEPSWQTRLRSNVTGTTQPPAQSRSAKRLRTERAGEDPSDPIRLFSESSDSDVAEEISSVSSLPLYQSEVEDEVSSLSSSWSIDTVLVLSSDLESSDGDDSYFGGPDFVSSLPNFDGRLDNPEPESSVVNRSHGEQSVVTVARSALPVQTFDVDGSELLVEESFAASRLSFNAGAEDNSQDSLDSSTLVEELFGGVPAAELTRIRDDLSSATRYEPPHVVAAGIFQARELPPGDSTVSNATNKESKQPAVHRT